MHPAQNGESNSAEIQEEPSFRNPNSPKTLIQEIDPDESIKATKLSDFIPIFVPTIENGLIPKTPREPRFLDFLKARPTSNWFVKFGFRSRGRFRVPFVRKINWKSIRSSAKKKLKSPYNIALLIWVILCAVGIIFLVILMTGLLNDVLRSHKRRDRWEEITNQILNALFTIMCVYQYPTITHHLILVVRWRPNDQVEARGIYSKKSLTRPHERAHISFVVFLLHLTCIDQFMYCALFWGWSKDDRPDWPQYALLGVGVAAPILAAWYTFYGPLGKIRPDENQNENENENSEVASTTDAESTYDERRIVVTSPEWVGGTFDCCDDVPVVCLSCFCTFCVFGWNLERMGMGNMYVHIFTFALLCLSPLWVFAITALNIDNWTVRIVVVGSGVVVCFLGLFYGGYWRGKIREKFKLPRKVCCGHPVVTDFLQWLFCWSCSLAQEVRTANFYDVEDGSFCVKVVDEDGRRVVVPLEKEEGGLKSYRSFSCPPPVGGDGNFELVAGVGRASTCSKVYDMKPPMPSLMGDEDEEKKDGKI